MIKNIRLAFRNILNNKGISAINIFGLALGIMVVFLICQYTKYEKSYDSYLDKHDQIYRLVFYRYYQTGLDKSVGNNYFVGQIAAEKIPEIEDFCRLKKVSQFIQAGDEIYKEERTVFADSSFFDIFSYQVEAGKKSEFLRSPGVAVITESTARKYFGNEDPVGKTIYGVNPGRKALIVQGVVKDVPGNSHLKFDIVISLSSVLNQSYCYSCNNTNTYFRIRKGSDPQKIGRAITDLAKENFSARKIDLGFPIEYKLQAVSDIHLHSNFRFEHEINGNIRYVNILSIIALLILLSAGLNYYNLYSSISNKRKRSTGIRIINGASGSDIIREFATEALLTGAMSLVLSFIMLILLFPLFRNFLDLDFNINSVIQVRSWLIPFLLLTALTLFIGWLMGMKIFNSAPLAFLKKESFLKAKNGGKRLFLIGQFIISIILIACTIGTIKQIRYMQDDAFTMSIDSTLVVKRPVASEYNSAQTLFQENLLKIPEVKELTFSTISPGEKNDWVKGGISIKGQSRLDIQIFQADVAPDFFRFFNVSLLAGRQFYDDENNWLGGQRHLILNREAVLALGETDINGIIGKTLYDSDNKEDIGEVVGVVDGYFQNSLDQEVKPTIFNCDQVGYFIFLKLKGGNVRDIISKVKTEYRKDFKDQYFEYYFLDDFFNSQYRSHIQLFRSYFLFSLLAIIITSLSLFGLVLMTSVSRVKEIGIRKVNGASVNELLKMLTKDYIAWICIAFAFATPIAWFSLHKWLHSFAYKTNLSWWIFALAVVIALIIALLTVSLQSWKAATRNPVEALRYE